MTIWSAEIKELEKLRLSIKENHPKLEKELSKLMKTDDENMALVYARRCLEIIITDLCETELERPRGSEPLKGIIDKLKREEKVPPHIIGSMSNINSISTFGAHPKEFDPRQVKPVLLDLNTTLGWYRKYSEKRKIPDEAGQNKTRTAKSNDKPLKDPKGPRKKILQISIMVLAAAAVAVTLFVLIIHPRDENPGDIAAIEKSIAVLPFVNWSTGDEYAHLGDAFANEIITELYKVHDFQVISYTSSARFRDAEDLSIRQIGEELGANFIIEGTVERQDENVNIHVQVIQAANDKHIWAKEYVGKWKDIFKIEDDIALNVAGQLKTVLTSEERDRIDKNPTLDADAYNYYLKGLYYYEEGGEEMTQKAIIWFEEAIRLDSAFALPWTYLAMCYWRQTDNSKSDLFKQAKEANERALELDPTLSISIVNMAEILDNEYNFTDAEKQIKLALSLDPDNQYVLRNAGRFYTLLGRHVASIAYCRRALEDDPNIRTALLYLIRAYYYAGEFEEALTALNKHDQLGYQFEPYQYYQLLVEAGLPDRIFNEPSYNGNKEAHFMGLAAAYFQSGRQELAESYCDSLIEAGALYYDIAMAYAYGDMAGEVHTWLDKSYEKRERRLTQLAADPAFRKYLDEPGIRSILQKMQFPD